VGGRGPRRLSEIAEIARRYGYELDEGAGKHNWRFRKEGERTYPIPAHNGLRTEIDFKYIRGLCRNLNIPLEAFTD
jgi:hypothetical protein